MSLDSLSLALTQIHYLVNSLNKKNYSQNKNSIEELASIYGSEAEKHLLHCCIAALELAGAFSCESSFGSNSAKSNQSSKERERDQHQLQQQLLTEFFVPRITQPSFTSLLSSVLEQPLRSNPSSKSAQLINKNSSNLLGHFCRLLRINPTQEVIIRVALLETFTPEARQLSLQVIKQKLSELLKNYTNQDSNTAPVEGGIQESSPEVIHYILCHLLSDPDHFGINKDLVDGLLTSLRRDYPRELVPVVLAPILYQVPGIESTAIKMAHEGSGLAKNMGENSLADLILETGYAFTANAEECRNHMNSFGLRELSAASVARALHFMARSHTVLDEQTVRSLRTGSAGWPDQELSGDKGDDGQPQSWNVEVFVQVVIELAPGLNWKDVVVELDHPGFLIRDRAGFRLLLTALQLGLQSQGAVFPVEVMFHTWNNPEGQLSLMAQMLKNTDLFCFADYPHHPINVEILKSPPEPENKKLANWKCLGLLETLLNLLENGGLYTQVQELLKEPVQHCPDVLVLGLLQLTQPMTKLKQELLSSLIPVFLGNHPNSAIILHHAWHAQSQVIKPLVMHAMAEWYMRAEHDQSRLSRILDVAQDLKALSMLLNVQRFPFVIDLSCLASRREYLKLDKWLTDKMREHGETFVLACVKFLQQRCPQILGNVKEDLGPKPSQLPPDTLAIMLSCLQACTGNVSPELSETIMTMVANCNVLNRTRAPPGVLKPRLDVSFPPGALSSQLFPPPGVEPSLSNLASSIGNMTIGSTPSTGLSSSTGFGVNIGSSGLTGSNPAPGSPGKLFPGLSMTDSVNLGALSGVGQGALGLPIGSNQSQGQSSFNILSTLAGSGGLPGSSGTNSLGIGIPPSSMGSTAQTGLGATGGIGPGSVGSPGGVPGSRMGMNPPLERRPGDVSSAFSETSQVVSKDIEDETNSYFQRIYNQSPHAPTLTVDEVLELLKKFQNSPNKREREIFDCMLRNLFEEYRFFPQYPDRELHITAQLFGGIMEHGLVTYMALGVALRYVLEAVRKPHGSKMYYFGITALDRFRHRLKEYPQYCQHLAGIQHFREFPPHLIEYIDNGGRGQEPPNRPHGPVLPQATTASRIVTPTTPATTATTTSKVTTTAPISGRPSIANATNIDTLLVASEKDDKTVVPPENIQDKISFIFNNLSQINLSQKCDELREMISDEHWAWVAQYLVMKRASIEPNFHTLYSNFLDTLKMPELSRLVVHETFRNIKVLLRSDKGIANFSDRSLLKNLGHWLGLLMLAKNRPILQTDIDLKSILVEAYHKGQQELLYVVPFVAKVLESCAKSKVFKPPNPWTLGIMNVLAELHQEPDLKLNLKFEVEVLCKTLSIDIHELKPGMVFKDHARLSRLEPQLSQPQMYQPMPQQHQHAHQVPQLQQQPPQSTSQQPPQQAQQPMLAGSPAQMQPQPGTTTPTPAHPVQGPPEPRFSYLDINVSSLNGLAQHLVVNNNIPLLQAHPHLKLLIRPAVERAVQECIHAVVDWSMKIALTTCEQIIKKDFALDPDETRMRAAAHHMVRSLSAGTALIRCRDHLLVNIANNLKTSFLTALQRGNTTQQKELVEQAATITAADNLEPACAFIQKTAVEKSILEIDKRLANEFDLRKHARNEGRRYYDPLVAAYQAERMPDPIRLKVTGVTPQQAAVYEEFARYIPGFLPVSERDAALLVPKMLPPFANDEIGVILEKVGLELERYLQSLLPLGTSSQTLAIGSLLEAVMLARTSRDPGVHITLLQKAFEGLVDSLTSFATGNDPEAVIRFRDAHLLVLKALQDQQAYGVQWTNRQVTRCWAECREEFRYNLDIFDCLVRAHLINLQQFDMQLANNLEQAVNPTGIGSSILALGFAMQLVHVYLLEGPVSGAPVLITENDLASTIELLNRINTHARQPPEGLGTILEMLRAGHEGGLMDRTPGGPGGPTALIHSGIAQARDYDDPHGLPEKTEYLLQEWVNMYHMPNAGRDSSKAFGHFVTQMSIHGVLKTDDLITRFFRLCTQICVDVTYRSLSAEPTADLIRSKAFHTLDAYVRLIALLIKHSGDASNAVTKVNLLNKVLGIVAGVLLQDQEVRSAEFQQLAYHRILIMLFLELNAPEQVLDAINFQVLTAFCHTLHILRPAKAPGFAYAWLEIVSHRVFIGRLLSITPQQKGWGMYAQLLINLFKFLAPFLRNAELSKPVSMLYKGTLRVLLVLLHDFPEFLCDYHYGFCDVIPPNCIQMRNLILSAFPRNMRLPDPFTPNLKVDMLPEISHAPRVLTHFAAMIQPPTLKKDLDSYLKTRGPVTFLSELRSVVQVHPSISIHVSSEPGMRYNLPLLNALVLYVGTQAIQSIQTKGLSPSMSTIGHSSYMDIFQSLAVNLDTEGRYLFINAIANQLRYPNSHTHYFSCVLLCLFAEANTEAIQEQITRVLLERLIVNRPHPWGLLITFIELIKNPVFKFWNHEFVHCAPEIEKLFESVARSCMVQKQTLPREAENHD